MTLTQSDVTSLLDAVRAGGDIDIIRKGVELVLQALIDAEATDVIGADRYQRSDTRTNQRNGSRDRLLTTKAGDVDLKIPKLRRGSFFPAILERRRRIDRALFAVVMEAYVHGVSTRKVDDLVAALGAGAGISNSEVSRICAGLDDEMAAFRTRPLGHVEFPYVFADATYIKGRVGGQVVSRAVVVATGVSMTGEREVLGCAVGDSEDEAFWTEFFRPLRVRGLHGVRLVISDHHLGLTAAIAKVFVGAAWQRCRVHFMRNVLAKVTKANAEMVAAAIRTIFAQPDADAVAAQFERITATLEGQFPEVTAMLHDAREDLLAFSAFPLEHWRKLWSTNPLERLHREIKRRTDVSACSPTTPPSTAWSPPSSSNSTTSGRWLNAATSPRPRWPGCATPTHRRFLRPSGTGSSWLVENQPHRAPRRPGEDPGWVRSAAGRARAARSDDAYDLVTGDHFSTITRGVIEGRQARAWRLALRDRPSVLDKATVSSVASAIARLGAAASSAPRHRDEDDRPGGSRR